MDVIITGLSKVGKSSIKRVVFEKMSPHESVFLETNYSIESYKLDNLGYTTLSIRDYPFNYNFEKIPSSELKFIQNAGVVIFVIDSQDVSDQTFDYLKEIITNIMTKNPRIMIEVFFHKADGAFFLQSNNMIKQNQELTIKINAILNEFQLESSPGFYKTSIYDHSLFEAFSKIFQKLMPQNSIFSKLLDNLSTCCRFEKAYLFDVFNKIYIAIDSSPMEEQMYEICTDMIDVVLDMSGIYGESLVNYDSNSFFDETSHSLIKINNVNRGDNSKSLLYLRFIDNNLALICVIKDEFFERQHLIDYNIKLFRDALKEIFKVSMSASQ